MGLWAEEYKWGGGERETKVNVWKRGSVGLFQQISCWKMKPKKLDKGFA